VAVDEYMDELLFTVAIVVIDVVLAGIVIVISVDRLK
jgi:hypothetical protein